MRLFYALGATLGLLAMAGVLMQGLRGVPCGWWARRQHQRLRNHDREEQRSNIRLMAGGADEDTYAFAEGVSRPNQAHWFCACAKAEAGRARLQWTV